MPVASQHPDRVLEIQRRLLGWFATNARDLPWRRTRDPYEILVSEVMLQQTQVDRVIPYYERFLEQFPTVAALADAPIGDVIRIWSGLGYNRRAVNLQRAAREVMEHFGGKFPTDPKELANLPGLGAYTAGAVAAFAFERDVTFLDTNMRRVLSRLVFGTETSSNADALDAAAQLLPHGKGWAWNQALIEFGALQCTARLPSCVVCPLQASCAAYPTIQSALAAKRTQQRRKAVEPFASTSRYFRGRIVEVLRTLPEGGDGVELALLGPKVHPGYSKDDLPWLRALVEGLQRDGLALIAEETPDYDGDAQMALRVRLP
jgi:A/G-specific adenine glycosylase